MVCNGCKVCSDADYLYVPGPGGGMNSLSMLPGLRFWFRGRAEQRFQGHDGVSEEVLRIPICMEGMVPPLSLTPGRLSTPVHCLEGVRRKAVSMRATFSPCLTGDYCSLSV